MAAPPNQTEAPQAVIADPVTQSATTDPVQNQIFGVHSANDVTAAATVALAIAAFITFGATVVSIWIIKKQLTLTRDALKSTDRALDIAEEANRIARNHSDRTLRAWVHIEFHVSSMTWLTDHLAINTETRLLNQGESPALDLRLAIKVEIVPSVSTVGHSIDVSDLPDRPITPLMSGNDFTHKERLNLDLTTINSALDVCKKAMFPPMIAIDIVAKYRLETDPPDTPDRLTSLRYMLGPKLNPTASNRLLGWNWLSYQGAGRGLAFTKGNDDSVRNHLT